MGCLPHLLSYLGQSLRVSARLALSGGSRYESGRNIPKPLALLLWLHQSGKISDKDLADSLK